MANELTTQEMLSSKVAADKQENVQSQNNPSNRDLNGTTTERNGVVKDKNSTNETKTVQEKKPTPNGDIKPPSSLPQLKKEKSALKTPTRKISPKSPDIGSNNSLGDKKKVPMNKIQVGSAPSPNLKVVRSKIGSLENYTHKPGGGKVKIENRKLEWKAQPRIEAKNDKYAPSGGEKKITQVKLQWSAKSKIGSLENATHKPGGGDKKIESVKLDFKDKAKPKVGSKDNIKHVPGGGTVKKTIDADAKSISSDIEEQKLDIKAQSKIGSLDNVQHKPGGGDKKIFDDKEYLKQMTITNENSKANSVTTSGSQVTENPQICSKDTQQKEKQCDDSITATSTSGILDKSKELSKRKSEQNTEKDKKPEPTTPKKSVTIKNEAPGNEPIKSNDSKSTLVQKSTQKLDVKKDKKSEQSAPVKKSLPKEKEITENQTAGIDIAEKSLPKLDTQKDKKSEPFAPRKSSIDKQEIIHSQSKSTEPNDKLKSIPVEKLSPKLNTQKDKKHEPSTPKKSLLKEKAILENQSAGTGIKALPVEKSLPKMDTQKDKKLESSAPKKSFIDKKEITMSQNKSTESNNTVLKSIPVEKFSPKLDTRKDNIFVQSTAKKSSTDSNNISQSKSTQPNTMEANPAEESLQKSDIKTDKKSELSTPKKSLEDKKETLQNKSVNSNHNSAVPVGKSSPKLDSKRKEEIESSKNKTTLQNENSIEKILTESKIGNESPPKDMLKDVDGFKDKSKTPVLDKSASIEERLKLRNDDSSKNNDTCISSQTCEKRFETKQEKEIIKTENIKQIESELVNKKQIKLSNAPSDQNLDQKSTAQNISNIREPAHNLQDEKSNDHNSKSISGMNSNAIVNEGKTQEASCDSNINSTKIVNDDTQNKINVAIADDKKEFVKPLETKYQNVKHEVENETSPKRSGHQGLKSETEKRLSVVSSKEQFETLGSQQHVSIPNKSTGLGRLSPDQDTKPNVDAPTKLENEISNPNIGVEKGEKEGKNVGASDMENLKSNQKDNKLPGASVNELKNIATESIQIPVSKSVPIEEITKKPEMNEIKAQNSNLEEKSSKIQPQSTLPASLMSESKK